MTIKSFKGKNMDKRIIFRLPDFMNQQVNEAVKNGIAKTPSELIRIALTESLKKMLEDSP
jgi:Arc/MetJ-type ribon-helix-helix transcriptional regulator